MGAPNPPLKLWYVRTNQANPAIERVPASPLQQQFNQKKPVPVNPVFVPANGVVVPTAFFQRGWYQAYVPSAGMRPVLSASAPPIPLSRPLIVKTTIGNLTVRQPYAGAKAPSPHLAP